MRLLKLEIDGFKSFMSRLELDFSSGITAIVGPNGCGKTNIVDAIRWVLGEQKTRLLRNTKMENVIFNGTKTRKPLGMAEVHLTLSNEDHSLPLDYNEVTISRRLYRSGVSEYCLNGEVSRLKDIKALLFDTGLGNHAYSIIEREMIDTVISDKDQDKRALFEEAAGIMRYRSQREEALRKIKLTETDIVRLDDIINELDKELRSLRYQRSKARRYIRLKEKVELMEGAVLKRRLRDLLVEYDRLKEQKKHHEEITLLEESELSKRESRLEELRLRATELERRLQGLHEERYRLGERIQQLEEGIAVARERIKGIESRIEENRDEIARTRGRKAELAADIEALEEEKKNREADLGRNANAMAELERGLELLEAEWSRRREMLAERKRTVMELAGSKGVEEHLVRTLRETGEKKRRLEEKAAAVEAAMEETRAALDDLRGRLDRTVRTKENRSEDLSLLSKRRGELERMLEECSTETNRLAVELGRLEEKKELLSAVARKHRERSEEEAVRSNGFLGYLADFVHVPLEYRKCFEACLAPVLDSLVAPSRSDAFSGVAHLRESGNGGYRVLYPAATSASGVEVGGKGVVGKAVDLIQCSAEVKDHLAAYLEGVFVVESVELAMELLERIPEGRLATLDGVFFDGPGRIVVSPAAALDVTLLEYEAKLRELDEHMLRLSSARQRELSRRKTLQSDLVELGEEEDRLRSMLSALDGAAGDLEGKIGQGEIERARMEESLCGLREQIEELHRTMTATEARLAEMGRLARGSRDGDAGGELAKLEEDLAGLELRREAMREEVSGRKLEEARLASEIANLGSRIENARKVIDELDELVLTRERDNEEAASKIEEDSRRMEKLEGEIALLHEEKEGVERRIGELSSSYEELGESCRVLEGEIKEIKARREEKREVLQQVSAALAAQETRVSSLLESARERLGEDFTRYVENRELLAGENLGEMDGEEFERMKRELERFGPVNMLAVEEYEEKKKRYDFLVAQKKDLEEARDSLLQAIRRINREARAMLSETFEKIRANFKATFSSLFDGGEADLYFADSDDPLEANIRIVANPKGKRLHDLSSLSGGERALVALSLLFAVYLVKPSPFCVFDEVDAPLDDANVGRFVNMLRSFTDRTQFIVITHNKKTMEAADCLYGVTMEEPGVSKMISVRLSEVGRLRSRARGAVDREAAPEEVPVQA